MKKAFIALIISLVAVSVLLSSCLPGFSEGFLASQSGSAGSDNSQDGALEPIYLKSISRGRLAWDDGSADPKTVFDIENLFANYIFEPCFDGSSDDSLSENGPSGVIAGRYAKLFSLENNGKYAQKTDWVAVDSDRFSVYGLAESHIWSQGTTYSLVFRAVEQTADGTYSVVEYAENALCFTFSDKTEIPSLEIKGSPSPGKAGGSATFKTDSPYVKSLSSVWARNSAGQEDSFTFTPGNYKAFISVTLKDGFVIGDDTVVTLNGQPADFEATGSGVLVVSPCFEIPCDHPEEYRLSASDRDCHRAYCGLCGKIIANNPHIFDSGTVFDDMTVFTCTGCGYIKTVRNSLEEIREVPLDMPVLTAGNTLGSAKIASGLTGKVSILSYRWYEGYELSDGEPLSPSAKAKNGWYVLEITVSPSSSCSFTEETLLTHPGGQTLETSFNGSALSAKMRIYCYEKASASLSFPEFTPDKTIGDVLLNILILRGEENRLNAKFRITAGETTYSVSRTFDGKWSADPGNIEDIFSKKILPSELYVVEAEFPCGKYYVDPNETEVNGEGIIGCTKQAVDGSVTVKAAIMSESNVISVVNVTSGSEFGLRGIRHMSIDSVIVNNSGPSDCSGTTDYTINVKADKGYVFAENTMVFVNGTAASYVRRGNDLTVTFKTANPGHDFSDWLMEQTPTCTDIGVYVRKCRTCGTTERIEIGEDGHRIITVPGHAATCVSEGVAEHLECSVCGSMFDLNGLVLPESSVKTPIDETNHEGGPLSFDESTHFTLCACGTRLDTEDHTFSAWVITTEPTETNEGLRQRNCTVCGFSVTEVVPKPEPPHVHDYKTVYDEEGHWRQCECGETTEKATHSFAGGYCTECGFKSLDNEETSPDPGPSVSTGWKMPVVYKILIAAACAVLLISFVGIAVITVKMKKERTR